MELKPQFASIRLFFLIRLYISSYKAHFEIPLMQSFKVNKLTFRFQSAFQSLRVGNVYCENLS